MKTWKLVALVLLGVLAVVLVYPGLPAGNHVELSSSERSAMLTCYYLHWYGLRRRDIDMSDQHYGPKGSFTDTACWLP